MVFPGPSLQFTGKENLFVGSLGVSPAVRLLVLSFLLQHPGIPLPTGPLQPSAPFYSCGGETGMCPYSLSFSAFWPVFSVLF